MIDVDGVKDAGRWYEDVCSKDASETFTGQTALLDRHTDNPEVLI